MFGKTLVHNFVSNKHVSQASYRTLKTTKTNFEKVLGSTNFQKSQLLSQLVHPFLLLNLYLPRYLFQAVIFMFHPFSGIFNSWKFNLVPRNFLLENGRKSPGDEVGGV